MNLETLSKLSQSSSATGQHILLDGEAYYRIANSQTMSPFFMSLVGSSDHWLFVASNGALTAGRKNADNALFPYYSSDKLVDLANASGPKTIVRTNNSDGDIVNWEPFSDQNFDSRCIRNLYKNLNGSRLHFEEMNPALNLVFRYGWEFSDRFGFVRTCHLANVGKEKKNISIIDGIHNILPYGMDQMFQLRFSNLGDAYKKCELVEEAQVGLYYLSSIPSDRAEPSEGLRATVVWQSGLNQPTILLSDQQLNQFRKGKPVKTETDIRGKRGAFFAQTSFDLPPMDIQSWSIVADLKYDQTDVANLIHDLETVDDRMSPVVDDLNKGQAKLQTFMSAADGIQTGENRLRTHRHQSNVIFNLMRGGTPFQGYDISVPDFVNHVQKFNRRVFDQHRKFLTGLEGPTMPVSDLIACIESSKDLDLIRIAREYLPFTFARRHGDPTRPWNKFSIELKTEDGDQLLNYEGNWRDIFQNWEALGVSYPQFINSMVLRFLNASTADGYNPYRVTKTGFDWEKPDPNDPWANIGYWGDHQIIYLEKLLEWSRNYSPDGLKELLTRDLGVYAELPYRIGNYEQILQDPSDTIHYDHALEDLIESRVAQIGSDGQLLTNRRGDIHRVNLVEKMLVPSLVKMSNFVPDGGIWLNTQRPEWNDANNALVGDGASIVTVCHLRRFFCFLKETVGSLGVSSCNISEEVFSFFENVEQILSENSHILEGSISGQARRQLVDQLQIAGSNYREALYGPGLSGEFHEMEVARLSSFADLCIQYLDQTIRSSKRPDGLFHSYNLLEFDGDELHVENLREMLEGQVAALSSQLLTPDEAIAALIALRKSPVYREDINSYLLYPDRDLPRFTEKNCIPKDAAKSSQLISTLLSIDNQRIVRRDDNGQYHFNGDFRNAQELAARLDALPEQKPELAQLVAQEKDLLLYLFEQTFDHRRFTGRSETFFAYEGLGSVYWHMVSKLALAVLEAYDRASQSAVPDEQLAQLKSMYREIRDGLGLTSSPTTYGAFPIDPYSHTPGHAGAQQPGMTGQVKEDVLARFLEIGVRIRGGVIVFEPSLFESSEFLSSASSLNYIDIHGNPVEIELAPGSFAFTFCQVPIIYCLGEKTELRVYRAGESDYVSRDCNQLTPAESQAIFMRDETIEKIVFYFVPAG